MAKNKKSHINTKEDLINNFELFQLFIAFPKNFELLHDFVIECKIYDELKYSKNDILDWTKDERVLFGAFDYFWDSVLMYCTIAYVNHNSTAKLISLFKSELTQVKMTYKKPYADFVVKILEDKNRFPFESSMLIKSIKEIDLNMSYELIDRNSFFAKDKELQKDSIIMIFGFAKTKREKIEEFFQENYSKELIEIASDYIPQKLDSLKGTEINKNGSIDKIDWKKDERLIPYLIHLLNLNGFLSVKNQFAFIEKYFTVNGKQIKRTNLKSNYNQADYYNKKLDLTPVEIKQLNEIINQLNFLLDKL